MLSGLQPWQWITFVGIPAIGLTALGLALFKLLRRSFATSLSSTPEPPEGEGVVSGRLLDRETLERIGGRAWGRPEQRRYIPDQFPGPIKCVIHKRELLPGQYFWETPLLDRQSGQPTGDHFAICTACQPGGATEVNRG